jgi:hypothetical protein
LAAIVLASQPLEERDVNRRRYPDRARSTPAWALAIGSIAIDGGRSHRIFGVGYAVRRRAARSLFHWRSANASGEVSSATHQSLRL